jgi:dihydroflavonol-4-reductase
VVLEGTRNAIEAAASVGVARVVLTSSSVTCGSSPRPESRDERDLLRDPDAPSYFRMKVRQEREALKLADELGIDLVAVCPAITVGGPDYRLLPSNAIIVNYLNDPFSFTFPGGCNVVHVEDVARGHVLVAEKGERGERYLLGSENMPWADIHQTIADLCGTRGPTLTATLTGAYLAASAMELAARWTKKPPASTRSEAKALGRYYWYRIDRAEALGYRPRSSRQALAQAIAWLIDSPHVSHATRARLHPSTEVTGTGSKGWRVIAGGRA